MDGRSRRAVHTETAILDAARDLFIGRGYVLTTMAAIAETAGVAERTVYVRFGTKAEILERLVDEVIKDPMGDAALGERLAVQARTAPTLEGRLSAAAEIMAAILCRGGPLMAVVHQAEFSEPSLGRAARAGRQGALTLARAAWRSIAEAGMLHPDSDPEWGHHLTARGDGYLAPLRPDPGLGPGDDPGLALPVVAARGPHPRPTPRTAVPRQQPRSPFGQTLSRSASGPVSVDAKARSWGRWARWTSTAVTRRSRSPEHGTNLSSMAPMWDSTVRRETWRWTAMAPFDRPSAIAPSTSRSRRDSRR